MRIGFATWCQTHRVWENRARGAFASSTSRAFTSTCYTRVRAGHRWRTILRGGSFDTETASARLVLVLRG